MTSKELSQLYHLNREIERQKKRLEYLTVERTNWTEHDSVMTSNGPGNTEKIERVYSFLYDHMDNPFREEIAGLREDIRRNMSKCIREQRRLEKYISSVKDSEIRLILAFRYINGLPWEQVAANIGPYSTADSVRMAHNRFLKSCSQCSEKMC